jgi:hypothetical protein
MEGVAIRAGHHCCQPLMAKLGVGRDEPRELLPLHDPEEIDRLAEGLAQGNKLLGLSEFDQMYREVILDHYKNPRGTG